MNYIRPTNHSRQAPKHTWRNVSAKPTAAIVNVIAFRQSYGKSFDVDPARSVTVGRQYAQFDARDFGNGVTQTITRLSWPTVVTCRIERR